MVASIATPASASASAFSTFMTLTVLVGVACATVLTYNALCVVSRVASPVWSTRYRSLSFRERRHWDSLFPAIAHAVFVVTLGMYVLFRLHASDGYYVKDDDALFVSTPATYITLTVACAYFVADAAIVRQGGDIVMAIHHGACVAGLSMALSMGLGHVNVMILLLTEVTTPFVHARWLLDKTGKKNTRLYMLNGVVLAVLWCIARVLLFPLYFIFTVNRSVLTFVPLVLFALNLYWFTLILRGLYKHASRYLRVKK